MKEVNRALKDGKEFVRHMRQEGHWGRSRWEGEAWRNSKMGMFRNNSDDDNTSKHKKIM